MAVGAAVGHERQAAGHCGSDQPPRRIQPREAPLGIEPKGLPGQSLGLNEVLDQLDTPVAVQARPGLICQDRAGLGVE